MPIYAYRCASCGHSRDVLQKISDPVLTTCPACGAEHFQKQVTAAGFQLKGSGWYVTDFRNGGGTGAAAPAANPAPASGDAPAAAPAPAPAPSSDGGGSAAASSGGSCGTGAA
ncbi:MAG TPA: FmdB family zinc ribbon protein, partial [Burkholderiaceae bacterium]